MSVDLLVDSIQPQYLLWCALPFVSLPIVDARVEVLVQDYIVVSPTSSKANSYIIKMFLTLFPLAIDEFPRAFYRHDLLLFHYTDIKSPDDSGISIEGLHVAFDTK